MTRQRNDGATQASDAISLRLITPVAILSYPHLFKAWAGKEGTNKPKFSAALIFIPETHDTDGFRKMLTVVKQCGEQKWGVEEYATMIQDGAVRRPFKRDWEKKGYPEDSIYINARSNTKPGIVMPFLGDDQKLAPLTDESLIYAGARVHASIAAFAYVHSGNMGVSFALNNVQWVGNGDRLDSRVNAADEFDAIETTAPSLDDMIG